MCWPAWDGCCRPSSPHWDQSSLSTTQVQYPLAFLLWKGSEVNNSYVSPLSCLLAISHAYYLQGYLYSHAACSLFRFSHSGHSQGGNGAIFFVFFLFFFGVLWHGGPLLPSLYLGSWVKTSPLGMPRSRFKPEALLATDRRAYILAIPHPKCNTLLLVSWDVNLKGLQFILFGISVWIKRRMVDFGKISFNFFKIFCNFLHLHLQFAKSAILSKHNFCCIRLKWI